MRGDGGLNLGVPGVITPAIDLQHKKGSITFNLTFDSLNEGAQARGINGLVNDVERYRSCLDDLVLGISRSVTPAHLRP